MMQTSKDRIKEKIRALLSKTVENGATQQEMESALDKANQLMLENFIADYELGGTEIERKCVSVTINQTESFYDIEYGKLHSSLNKLFDCRSYSTTYTKPKNKTTPKTPNTVTFFGYDEDVEMCIYFYTLITKGVLKAKDRYQFDFDFLHFRQNGYGAKELNASFIKGFIFGVCDTMNKLYENRMRNLNVECYSLMVVEKAKNVADQYATMFPNMKKARKKKLFAMMECYAQGKKIGENFKLVQGLNENDVEPTQLLV